MTSQQQLLNSLYITVVTVTATLDRNLSTMVTRGGVIVHMGDGIVTIISSAMLFESSRQLERTEIRKRYSVNVIFRSGDTLTATIGPLLRPEGFCVLYVRRDTNDLKVASINEEDVVIRSRVMCISHPVAHESCTVHLNYTVSTGDVCNIGIYGRECAKKNLSKKMLLLLCDYHSGPSAEGGPVFNRAGQFVGIHVGHTKNFSYSFAVPSLTLKDALKKELKKIFPELECDQSLFGFLEWLTRREKEKKGTSESSQGASASA